MRKLRHGAFINLYNSKPLVKAEVTFGAKVHQILKADGGVRLSANVT